MNDGWAIGGSEIDSLFLLLLEGLGEGKTSLFSKTHGGKKHRSRVISEV
jgi:hypothetical protein